VQETFGKYKLIERLASGGMAEVFVATVHGEAGFSKPVVIKRLHPRLGEDSEFARMLIDEARITAQLTHTNICQVLDLGQVEGSYFIAMEYIAGEDLRAVLEQHRRQQIFMPVEAAVHVVSELLAGLDYAHRKEDMEGHSLGVVHRDISPQNVLISYEGEVKIIDFGIAKARQRIVETQAGVIKGKFRYMAPEQASGQPLDSRTDIFAAGVVLYELLRGEPHSLTLSDTEVIRRMQEAEFEPIRRSATEVPDALLQIVSSAMQRKPRKRFQSAADFRRELLVFLAERGDLEGTGRRRGGTLYGRTELATLMRSMFPDERRLLRTRLGGGAGVVRPEQLVGAAAASGRGLASAPKTPAPAEPAIEPAPAPPSAPGRRADQATGAVRAPGSAEPAAAEPAPLAASAAPPAPAPPLGAGVPSRTTANGWSGSGAGSDRIGTVPLALAGDQVVRRLPTGEMTISPLPEREGTRDRGPGAERGPRARQVVTHGGWGEEVSVTDATAAVPLPPPPVRPREQRATGPRAADPRAGVFSRQDPARGLTTAVPDASEQRRSRWPAPGVGRAPAAPQAGEPVVQPRGGGGWLGGLLLLLFLAGVLGTAGYFGYRMLLLDEAANARRGAGGRRDEGVADPAAESVAAEVASTARPRALRQVGRVRVLSRPAGAAITLCDRDTGQLTPATVALQADRSCTLRLEHEAFLPFELPVRVAAGRQLAVQAVLRRRVAARAGDDQESLLVVSSVQVGTVYLDDRAVGQTPRLELRLPAGRYAVQIHYPALGIKTPQRRISLPARGRVQLHFDPAP